MILNSNIVTFGALIQMLFFKWDNFVRGSQICNLFGPIRYQLLQKSAKLHDLPQKKNPENLLILISLPNSDSNESGCFSKRNLNIQPVSSEFYIESYKNCPECCGPLFLLHLKTCKIEKKSLFRSRRSALIPLVKYQGSIDIITTRDIEKNIETHTLLLLNPWGGETPYNRTF
jgi:hypothetical protein